MKMQFFLLRPNILENESLSGYLERICIVNGYLNPSWIRKQLFSSSGYQVKSNLLNDVDIEKLACILGRQEEDLKEHGLMYWNYMMTQNKSERYLLKNKVKYCPSCIKEHLHHQYLWGLNMICVCIKHNCELLDSCSQCSSQIDIHHLYFDICPKCKYEYSKAEVINVDPRSTKYLSQSEIYEAILNGENLLRVLGDIPFPKFLKLAEASFHLLEGLIDFTEESSAVLSIFRKKDIQFTNTKYLRSFTNVWWMYQNFPNNFIGVLNSYLSKKRSQKFIQKEQFEKILDDFPIIKKVYQNFWIEQLDKGSIRKNFALFKSNERLLEERSMISMEEAKKLIGMSRDKIYKLADIGEITISNAENANTYRTLVDEQSVIAYIEKSKKYVSRNVAAKIIGIQKASLVDLVSEGFIKELKSPYFAFSVILCSDIDNLLKKCRGELINAQELGMISFHDALIKYSVSRLSISHILRFILGDKLHPKSLVKAGNLADTLYYEKELKACVRGLKTLRLKQDGYYLTEVMEMLGIGEKKMRSLVERKELVPSKVITWKDGRKRYLFEKEKVEAYQVGIKS